MSTSAEEVLRARAATLPSCLAEVAAGIVPEPRTGESFVVTGIGASEGPARAMASLLRAAWGARAAFVPLSSFLVGEPRALGDVLVVFSQALSPNARLALSRAGDFERTLLFTSTPASAVREPLPPRVRVVELPAQGGPARDAIQGEQGTLVRLLGPAAAMLAAALSTGAASAADVPALLSALRSAPARARDAATAPTDAELEGPLAFVTAGGYGELCGCIPTHWLEALYVPRPPILDVLELAHGPFQAFYDAKVLLVALERTDAERALFDRLAQMLVPERHRLVRLTSTLPSPLAPLDHLAQTHELVCRAIRTRPRDLYAWPGSGRDGPLYHLGE
jgi:hypothetical protein